MVISEAHHNQIKESNDERNHTSDRGDMIHYAERGSNKYGHNPLSPKIHYR
jgi:hypothetical protein